MSQPSLFLWPVSTEVEPAPSSPPSPAGRLRRFGRRRARAHQLVLFPELVPQISPRLAARIRAGLVPDASRPGCLIWPGARNRDGYGVIQTSSNPYFRQGAGMGRVHRLLWQAERGPIPVGAVLRHTCDNPPCCNLNHLKVGTHRDNIADAVAKGRQARGERHGRSRLTADLIPIIRASPWSSSALAKRFNVSRDTIEDVRAGRTWRHVAARGVPSYPLAPDREPAP